MKLNPGKEIAWRLLNKVYTIFMPIVEFHSPILKRSQESIGIEKRCDVIYPYHTGHSRPH